MMLVHKGYGLKKIFTLGGILGLSLLILTAQICADYSSELKFYVFGTRYCSSCVERVQQLINLYGEAHVLFYELYEGGNLEFYKEMVTLLNEAALLPLVGVFKNGNLTAVVIGVNSEEVWKSIVKGEYEGLPVFYDSAEPKKIIRDQKMISRVAELFTKASASELSAPQNFFTLLPLVAAAAVVDAVNPCEFSIFVILLAFVLFDVGKRAVLKTGLAFTAAVFIVYFLMGLGLIRVLAYFSQLKYVIIIFAFTIGALEILEFLGKARKRVPDAFSRRIFARLKKALNPRAAFVAGIITASLLLPCTSGPYFIALSLMTEATTFLQGLALLAVYNAIIIAPFLAITLGVYALTLTTMDLKIWLSENQRWLNLFAGAMMIFLGLILTIL